FRHHCFVSCFKSIDLDLFVLFVCVLCTFSSGIQKRISSSPNAIKLIVFSFIRISLAYTELKRIYEGFLFSYSKSHCYVPLKLWILVWVSVLAFGPVPSLVYGLLGFYPAWRLSDPICKCTIWVTTCQKNTHASENRKRVFVGGRDPKFFSVVSVFIDIEIPYLIED
ncbi:hypothetical protein ES288_D13G288600v1, partial [Gossypium darwinii]